MKSLSKAVAWTVAVLLACAGCTAESKPGVTCNVCVLAQGTDGKFIQQGSVTRIESAPVNTTTEIPFDGGSLTVLVRKTEHGKVTLDVTFPDSAMQRAKINAGETKDILSKGQKVGLRVEVQDCF